MNTLHPKTKVRGFSLIEVLLAVAVMSFGLLALAALQTSLFRSGSESKAQSVALSLAKERLEQLRAFNTYNEYLALIPGADPTISLGGVDYSRNWTIARYGFNTSLGTPAFQLLANNTAVLSSNFATNNEFKRVAVAVGWVDSAGLARTVQLEDAVGAISPTDSARVAKESTGGAARKPVVIIQNPESIAGVIPIAIGDGSDTAATNPRPTQTGVTASNNNIETRFDVITYVGLSDNVASAQARVETAVVGCKCSTDSTRISAIASAEPPQRPTFWNGLRYVTPKAAQSATPLAGTAAVTNLSPRCEACCRDHHDPSSEGIPKFDPRRSDAGLTHTHYNFVSNALQVATAGGEYIESCRLIRVDGVWRVAQDFSLDHQALVQTTPSGGFVAEQPLPSELGKTRYEEFVLKYLKERYVTATSSFNTIPAQSLVASYESGLSAGNLNDPSIPISSAKPQKWLHSRGLYIDWLELEAKDAIATAKANCEDGDDANTTLDADEIQACVMRVLPFTSVNITELTNWTSSPANVVTLLNTGFRDSSNDNANLVPVRGRATLVSSPSGDETDARSDIWKSNSGIAVAPWPVDPDDNTTIFDSQGFTVSDASGGGNETGEFFTLRIGGTIPIAEYTGNNSIVASFTISGVGPQECIHQKLRDHDNNPATPAVPDAVGIYTCELISGQAAGLTTNFRVSDYNRQAEKSVPNVCKNGTTAMPYLLDYDLAVADAGSISVQNENKVGSGNAGEMSLFTIDPVVNESSHALTFSGPAFLCPNNWELFLTNGGAGANIGNGNDANDFKAANCEGSGSVSNPKWDTNNWKTCPSGLTFP